MSYFETGSALDVNDLLGKLRTALAAHGWTTLSNSLEGATGGTRCHLSKGSLVVNLRTGFNNEIPLVAGERSSRQGAWDWNYAWNAGGVTQFWRPSWLAMNVGTGLNLSSSWANQPGAPGKGEGRPLGVMILASSGISRYWLFVQEGPDAVFLVCETAPGKFEQLSWGMLDMSQQVEAGGEWFSGQRTFNNHFTTQPEPITAVMARLVDSRWDAVDQLDGWGQTLVTPSSPNTYSPGVFWSVVGLPAPSASVYAPYSSGFYAAISAGYIADEGRSVILPIAVWKAREGGYTLLGHLPHIGRISMQPYLAGDPMTGVGETYLAFPGHCRATPWNTTQYGAAGGAPSAEEYNFYGLGYALRRP